MSVELDHVVYAGPNLAALVGEVHRATGVESVPGGCHEGRGTANSLLGLGSGRYLELLGPDPHQGEPDRPRPLRVDELAEPRLVGWAVCTAAIKDVVSSARRAGYDPGRVAEMSRRTPDGQLLRSQLTPPEGGLGGAVPFLIDWQGSPHPSHGVPEVQLEALRIASPEPDGVSVALRALGAEHFVTVSTGASLHMSTKLEATAGTVRLG